jgi:DNA-binding MarR family transcriptional regulator
MSKVNENEAEQLAGALHTMIGVFLVAERAGAPAEGALKFNPLQFHILGSLTDDGPTRSSVLAHSLGVKRSTLSSAAERLVGLGLIERRPLPTDGRAAVFSLTAAGAKTSAAIRRQDIRNAAAALEGLTAVERKSFLPLISKVALQLRDDRKRRNSAEVA